MQNNENMPRTPSGTPDLMLCCCLLFFCFFNERKVTINTLIKALSNRILQSMTGLHG